MDNKDYIVEYTMKQEKSLGLGVLAATLSMGLANHAMHLHPWSPNYIHNKSNRLDKAAAKRKMSTKERVEARKKN